MREVIPSTLEVLDDMLGLANALVHWAERHGIVASLDIVKLIESRNKTVAMLENRIQELSKPEYKGVFAEVVKVSQARLGRVRLELSKYESLLAADSRQLPLKVSK